MRYRYMLILIAISIAIYIAFMYAKTSYGYRDEDIYISCGIRYIEGVAPRDCNFEHPPLGKYIAGLSFSIGMDRYITLIFYIASILALYKFIEGLTNPREKAFVASILFATDTIIVNVYRHILLDVFSTALMLIALYMLYSNKKPWVVGIFTGFALASKLSVLPLLAIPLLIKYVRKPGNLSIAIATAIAIYIAIHAMDIARYSIYGFIEHQIDMANYMMWRHSISLPIVVNGILKLYTKIEIWRYTGIINIYIHNYTVENLTTTLFREPKLYIDIYIAGGTPLWYLNMPITMITTYRALTKKQNRDIAILLWTATTTAITGPLDWYYTQILPYTYTAIAINTEKKIHKTILIAINILWTTLTILGITPWKKTIVIEK